MTQKSVETIKYADTSAILTVNQEKAPTDLSRSIQVIGAGFSRTGTVSFTLALEKLLKGPVCHSGSASLVREEAFIKKWIEILDPKLDEEGKVAGLQDLLAGYVGVTDSPGYMVVGELVEAFPDAKVICTTRDKDKWWDSMAELMKTVNPWWIPYVFWSMPTLRWFGKWAEAMTKRRGEIYPPGMQMGSEEETMQIHYDYVKRVTPPERLFFFSVKDGWEPLCKFLDLPVPDEPFPHANDKLAVKEAFVGLIKQAALKWLQFLFVPGAAIAIGFYALNQR